MYLSQLILSPRSRQVRSEVSQPYEMHRTLLKAFPDQVQDGPGRVLFRLESQDPATQAGLKLLVQSDREPDWRYLAEKPDYLAQEPAYKQFEPVFQPGQRLRFRLRANPTVKRMFPGEEKSKRIGLYKEEEQRDWLARKAEQGGFDLLGVQVQQEDTIGGVIHRPDGKNHDLNLLAVRFDGLLQVTDPVKFLETVQQGIGSGKGLGFGLLSLARAAAER
ncbi:MAG: type I-E CRISPR-associated protein Cas6/Cse3/CasE [Anaerolineae bacterium]|nr:type I-E CRISPR-associated protein Cas6/Cse3/CasE [Anaerolineae bacterium]